MNFRPVGLMLLFCLIPLWAFAQSVMVKGVVKDTSGEAIIGASVLEKRHYQRYDYRSRRKVYARGK